MWRSPNEKLLPAWLSNPGPVFLRKFVRSHKNDALAEEVKLTDENLLCARVRFPDGRGWDVSVRDLAPFPVRDSIGDADGPAETAQEIAVLQANDPQTTDSQISNNGSIDTQWNVGKAQESDPVIRRSTQKTRGVPPVRYGVDQWHFHDVLFFVGGKNVVIRILWLLSYVQLMCLCRGQNVLYSWLQFNAARWFLADSNAGCGVPLRLFVVLHVINRCVLYMCVMFADGTFIYVFSKLKPHLRAANRFHYTFLAFGSISKHLHGINSHSLLLDLGPNKVDQLKRAMHLHNFWAIKTLDSQSKTWS